MVIRPRKLGIISDQGKEYTFLLKGHEDLRQDERVMQLFGLINNLLQNNRATAKYHILIRRYLLSTSLSYPSTAPPIAIN